MTISRRQALGWASAFAATTCGTAGTGLAAALKGASKSQARGGRSEQTAQRFLEVLIHHDEAGKQPHVGFALDRRAKYRVVRDQYARTNSPMRR